MVLMEKFIKDVILKMLPFLQQTVLKELLSLKLFQKVNKTSSAVRLTHIPTGIVVASQVERSQYQNRDVAMNMLISKLVEIKEREHLEKIEDIKGVQKEITWGSQIRSYVFMPYTMVKDHRTGFETGNIQAVMDGDLDGFINAYLKCASLGTLQK